MAEVISQRRKCFLWFPITFSTYTIIKGYDDLELISETGLLFKKIDKLKLYKINDVSYTRTVGNFFCGVAQVKVFSSDASTSVLTIRKIKKARDFMNELEKLTAEERKRMNIGYREGVIL